MYFNLRKSAVSQSLAVNKIPLLNRAKIISGSFLILTAIFLVLFIFTLLSRVLPEGLFNKILGGGILSLTLTLFFAEVNLLFKWLEKPFLRYSLEAFIESPNNYNIASFLEPRAALFLRKSIKKAKKLKLEKPPNAFLLSSLLNSRTKEVSFIFERLELNKQEVKKALKREFLKKQEMDSSLREVILRAAHNALAAKKERITEGDLLYALSLSDKFFKEFLIAKDLTEKDVKELCLWFQRAKQEAEKIKKFWLKSNLLKKGSLARDFASGFSITLDRYSYDLRARLGKGGFKEIIGHKQEVERVEAVLTKDKINNCLLVGEPGSGRKSIIEAVAQKAFLGESSETLNYKRFLMFDPSSLIVEITSLENCEALLDMAFAEAVSAGNIVLIIDNFEQFVSQSAKPGTLNIFGILAKYLPLSSFQIMAITSYDGLHQIIERQSSLLNLFEKVEAGETTDQETFHFLENFIPFLENKYKVFIAYKALKGAVDLSGRYITDTPFPDKALRLLDESLAFLKTIKGGGILRESHIEQLLEKKTDIPLKDMEEKEKHILLNLESLIHQRIVNQKQAVSFLANSLRRARANLRIRRGPMGCFLFLGPTGVGKTETAKALSQVYFASEQRMIRLDMSEFQNTSDIERLIGSAEINGILSTAVRENPFSLVLLDEIEKANPAVLNLFLQVFDEGWFTDGTGKRVDFRNTIIISTSNAGCKVIREDIEQNKKLDMVKDDLLDFLFKKEVFSPEFINRFDGVVVFKPLTREHLLRIAYLILNQLADNLKDKGIKLETGIDLQERIVELGYNPTFGAREMRRVVQEKVGNVLSKAILSGELKRGDRVAISRDFALIVNKDKHLSY